MSDPGRHSSAIAGLPSEVGRLNGVVQGVLVHSDWLAQHGLDPARLGGASRATLPVADRIEAILASDPRPLGVPRPPGRRSVGTCRDFALLLCCFLRCKGIPARVRCGFAAYFGGGWEDHWVCEYRDRQSRRWRLGDPQIDGMLKARNRIAFDPADVPRRSFLTAGQAWLRCRRGTADAARFGHGETTGPWFLKVNVVRDHYVLNGRETSAWDGWRAAAPPKRVVGDGEIALLDSLAARPHQPLVEIAPDWLA